VSHKEEICICRRMDRTGNQHVERDKPSSKRQNIACFCPYGESRPKMMIVTTIIITAHEW
jgi:hypothetical protein